MSTTTDLTTLKINYLTQAQYDAEASGGTINENEIYMTPYSYTGLLNFFYPVGSYYETSDATFNPNTAWGGTWVLDSAGRVTEREMRKTQTLILSVTRMVPRK